MTEEEPLVTVISAVVIGPGLSTLSVPENGPAVTSAELPGPGFTITSASLSGPGSTVLSAQVSGPPGRPGAAAPGALRIVQIGPEPDGERTVFDLPEAVSTASLHVNGYSVVFDGQRLHGEDWVLDPI